MNISDGTSIALIELLQLDLVADAAGGHNSPTIVPAANYTFSRAAVVAAPPDQRDILGSAGRNALCRHCGCRSVRHHSEKSGADRGDEKRFHCHTPYRFKFGDWKCAGSNTTLRSISSSLGETSFVEKLALPNVIAMVALCLSGRSEYGHSNLGVNQRQARCRWLPAPGMRSSRGIFRNVSRNVKNQIEIESNFFGNRPAGAMASNAMTPMMRNAIFIALRRASVLIRTASSIWATGMVVCVNAS